jgi:hypothetical protein
MLQVQSSKDLNLWQTFHEIAEKSSKIVPLGAPSSGGPARRHGLQNVRSTLATTSARTVFRSVQPHEVAGKHPKRRAGNA